MSLKPGIIERYRKALPLIKELIEDLEQIENSFRPAAATEEERSQVKHLRALSGSAFDEAGWRIERMFLPVVAQGRLVKNSSGRYEIEGTDYYFTSGSSCEIYVSFYEDDEPGENMTWVPTRIEHNKDYYFVARPGLSPAGVLARVRR